MIDVEQTALGRIAVDDEALTALVRAAAQRVEGVHAVRGRTTSLTMGAERAVTVAVGISCAAGTVLPDVARRVQDEVGRAVRTALEPGALRVDVTVEEVAG